MARLADGAGVIDAPGGVTAVSSARIGQVIGPPRRYSM